MDRVRHGGLQARRQAQGPQGQRQNQDRSQGTTAETPPRPGRGRQRGQAYRVANAVNDFLAYGLPHKSKQTRDKLGSLANKHIIPSLGARKLPELTAEEVDEWLAGKAKVLATRSLREVVSVLRRAVARAQKREKVRRNVVLLCEVPVGRRGRPSRSLTLRQAGALLAAAEASPLRAYIVVSLLTGARTEEMRALTWSHVDLVGKPKADSPVPPHIMVWRSVRNGGDTKTRKSRRSIALPKRCVDALKQHRAKQRRARKAVGESGQNTGIVFSSVVGTALDAANVRRVFRRVVKDAGLVPELWTPRELRHSFVSLMSDDGVSIEDIARLVGHDGTAVTEEVYRHQLRPIIESSAEVMDQVFKPDDGRAA